MRNAEQEFVKKNYDSACRKYEEVSNLASLNSHTFRLIAFGDISTQSIRTGALKESTILKLKKLIGRVKVTLNVSKLASIK